MRRKNLAKSSQNHRANAGQVPYTLVFFSGRTAQNNQSNEFYIEPCDVVRSALLVHWRFAQACVRDESIVDVGVRRRLSNERCRSFFGRENCVF